MTPMHAESLHHRCSEAWGRKDGSYMDRFGWRGPLGRLMLMDDMQLKGHAIQISHTLLLSSVNTTTVSRHI